MLKPSATLGVLSLAVVCAASACGDNQGSTVSAGPPGVAGTKSSGSGGSPPLVTPKPGSSGSSSGGSGSGSGVISTEACPGLPIPEAMPPSRMTNEGGAGGAPDLDGSAGEMPVSDQQGGASSADEACLGVSLEAEAVPVDLFIMMDRSQSMGYPVEGSNTTRWEALRDAVQGFVQDPDAADVRMGIGFFSLTGAGDDALDCSDDSYAEPSVPIGALSEVGEDLVGAIDAVAPAGLTPTVPALEGAVAYARAWAMEHRERATIVALVTDGFPTQCSSAPEAVVAAAESGYKSAEHIRTFVIGVGDVAKYNLDNYARAGGTGRALLTDSGNVTSSFVTALGNITNRALACEYQIPTPPSGMKLDTTKVQVVYSPASGAPEEVPSIESLGACANNPNGGWYYDDANHPSKITVCPCTCARLQAGTVDVRLGCKPRLGLR